MERPFESMKLEKVCTYGACMHVSCAALMHLSGTWLFPWPLATIPSGVSVRRGENGLWLPT